MRDGRHADNRRMGRVECLHCGEQRLTGQDVGECPRCRYVGWAPVEKLDETLRRRLREVTLAERRHAAPWLDSAA